MPRGTAFDLETTKLVSGTEIKKEAETATTEVWKPATGKRFRLCGFTMFVDTALALVTLEDETTGIFVVSVEKLTGLSVVLPGQGYLSTKADNKLKIKLSSTNKVTATFYGVEE